MMTATTTQLTTHGDLSMGTPLVLPAGTLVSVILIDNKSPYAPTRYWATPVDPKDVSRRLMKWANDPGIRLGRFDLKDFRTDERAP